MDLNKTKSSNDTQLDNKVFDMDHTVDTNSVLRNSLKANLWTCLVSNTLDDTMMTEEVENTCNMDVEEMSSNWEVVDAMGKAIGALVEVAFVVVVFVDDNDVDENDLVRIRLPLTHEYAKLNENLSFIADKSLFEILTMTFAIITTPSLHKTFV